ncbi:MAG: hypothetical protein IOD12_07480 [Silvanigrellales bacterium]|nr:hypothetical protein [Silvanigrellales bacterium]
MPLFAPSEMVAIVLCAGLGTRLRPLTRFVPKTAVPLGRWPLALHNVLQLLQAGATTVHCNTHYLAPFVENELARALEDAGYPATALRFWREEPLLETGGGVAHICQSLAREEGWKAPKDALVVSGDIYGDIPLQEMISSWSQADPLQAALLCTREAESGRTDVTWVDPARNCVVGFGKDVSPSEALARGLRARNFSNHQIVRGAVVENAHIEKRSSIDLFYRAALSRGLTIAHVELAQARPWFNVGTYREYEECVQSLTPLADFQEAEASDDYSPPTQCLVVSLGQKKGGEGALTFPASPALRLPLCPWPFTTRRLGCLRTLPCSEQGESLATILSSLLPNLVASLFSPSFSGGGWSPRPETSPLVFRLPLPTSLGWALSHPLLVPLELFETSSFGGGSWTPEAVSGLYATSETFFLLTPVRSPG